MKQRNEFKTFYSYNFYAFYPHNKILLTWTVTTASWVRRVLEASEGCGVYRTVSSTAM